MMARCGATDAAPKERAPRGSPDVSPETVAPAPFEETGYDRLPPLPQLRRSRQHSLRVGLALRSILSVRHA